MKIIKLLLKILFILLIIYLISAFLAKSSYKVERSAIINAPQKLVYNQLGILRNWENWSPWKEKDPASKNTYEGQDGRVGSRMKWVGEKRETGSGQVELLAVDSPAYLKYQLVFKGPPDMSSNGSFLLTEPSADKTKVIWTMSGDIIFVFRPIMMFMSMDKMMGPDFERGLVKLDSICVLQKINEMILR